MPLGHNSQVDVESYAERTTFTLYFPHPPAVQAVRTGTKGKSITLALDLPVVGRFMLGVLICYWS